MKMDKFKLLRMKFEQKRKEKEQLEAEIEESEEEDIAKSDTPLSSTPSPSEGEAQTHATSGVKLVKKPASMPAGKPNFAQDNKPQLPDFLRRKKKPASMAPAKRDSDPLPTNNKPDFLKRKSKPASMTPMKPDAVPQPTNKKPDFLKPKSKPASMPAMKSKEPPPVAKKPDFLKAKLKPASINVGKNDLKSNADVKQDSQPKPKAVESPKPSKDIPSSKDKYIKASDDSSKSKAAGNVPVTTRQDSQSKIKAVSKEHSKRVRIAEASTEDSQTSVQQQKEQTETVLKSALKERPAESMLNIPQPEIEQERRSSLTDEKLQELQETFMVFDLNRDGVITNEELGAVLFALGQRPTYDEINDLIRSVDLDRNGTIEFDEFVTIFSSKLIIDPEQELYEVFCTFDENQDGLISPDELLDVLLKLGEQITKAEAVKMIEEADIDMDGFVDYMEFKHILNIR